MKFNFFAVFATTMLITGCQSTLKAPPLSSNPPVSLPSETAEILQPDANTEPHKQQFQITGKIGVKTPQQNGSAFYGWTQDGDHFAIDLTGAMGIGQTSIRGTAGNVTLVSSKTGTLQAETPEELLYKATKWEAPITYLTSWINAQPAEPAATLQHDDQQRIKFIQEGGWQATLNYQANEKLPNKLVLIDDHNQNRVTLTIQTRQ